GDEYPHEEGHLHIEDEGLGRTRVDELDVGEGAAQRLGEEVEDLLVPVPAEGGRDAERDQAVDEPHPQLLEVLEEGHPVGMRPRHRPGQAPTSARSEAVAPPPGSRPEGLAAPRAAPPWSWAGRPSSAGPARCGPCPARARARPRPRLRSSA